MPTEVAKSPRPADAIIGANIRAIRVSRRFSQEKLGEACGITFQQIQKYENGSNRVGGSRAVEIARALGCQVGDLFLGLEVEADGPAAVDTGAIVRDRQELELLEAFRRCPPATRTAITNVARAAGE